MSVLRNIRKVTALVLLALMLVIQGVKLFHQHPEASLPQHKSYSAVTPAAHHCAICDFQLTRDADVAAEQFSFAVTQPVTEILVDVVASYNIPHPSERCLRGPPVTC